MYNKTSIAIFPVPALYLLLCLRLKRVVRGHGCELKECTVSVLPAGPWGCRSLALETGGGGGGSGGEGGRGGGQAVGIRSIRTEEVKAEGMEACSEGCGCGSGCGGCGGCVGDEDGRRGGGGR